MTRAILDGLDWLGLDWDEGPYHQAEGLQRHRAEALELLRPGEAYRCFCTAEQIEARRSGGDGVFRYDRHCLLNVTREESDRRAAAGEPYTVRFRVPDGITAWDDVVHGRIEFANTEIEDFIILRTDGTPIYNMAVVSDDVHMSITHVIRGDDHISNTPKQILLYQALGRPLPAFGHVPLILGPDGKRLSKRHGATAVGEYRNQGILADAMVNFLALLGWSPGTDEEVFTRDELIARFSLDGINTKSAIFDVRKLSWLNGQHLSRSTAAELAPLVTTVLVERGLADEAMLEANRDWLHELIDLLKVRARDVGDIADQAQPYFRESVAYEPAAVEKHWSDGAATAERLRQLRDALASVVAWEDASVEAALRGLADALGIGAGKLIHPLRVALTGQAVSPGIFEVARVLGRDRTLRRLDTAVARLESVP
jgi:glutamyl-tRNA synthetase